MHRETASFYRDPCSGAVLRLEPTACSDDDVVEGCLVSPEQARYPIRNGIPDLSFPQQLSQSDARVRNFYEGRVEDYDRYLHLTFETFGEREQDVREAMIDRLELKPDASVLEVGCGSGRDSEFIARRIPDGRIFCTDIAPQMLAACKERLKALPARVEIAVANAAYLPFPDRSFDALFQFGGVGEFGDIRRFFAEAIRVVRTGGRVVVGDESMPVWLRDTDFSKMLTFTNPQYAAPVPLEHLPIEARNVHLRWIIGGTFYLIDFTVGEGEPFADFDFVIPGPRGGTRRTRYYGQLEGVSIETKALAQRARERAHISMHDWLERVVRTAALRELDEENKPE